MKTAKRDVNLSAESFDGNERTRGDDGSAEGERAGEPEKIDKEADPGAEVWREIDLSGRDGQRGINTRERDDSLLDTNRSSSSLPSQRVELR